LIASLRREEMPEEGWNHTGAAIRLNDCEQTRLRAPRGTQGKRKTRGALIREKALALPPGWDRLAAD